MTNRRTMTMALAPPAHSRRERLLALSADPTQVKHGRKRGGLGFIVFMTVLLIFLLPLGLLLFALIGYLTLIVMTLALAAGLALVVALI
jgi:hypothetical protein